jgi:hypothetical protein
LVGEEEWRGGWRFAIRERGAAPGKRDGQVEPRCWVGQRYLFWCEEKKRQKKASKGTETTGRYYEMREVPLLFGSL